MEIIKSIEEICDYEQDKNSYIKYDGYKIITSKQEILLLIDNHQCCCERWGNMVSNDIIEDFIGSKLLNIVTVDDALSVTIMKFLENEYIKEESVVFINLETDKGTLQFVLYNEHNGYYSHDVLIHSNQLKEEFSL